MLNQLPDVEVTGLINHAARQLRSRKWKDRRRQARLSQFNRLHIASRLAMSTKADPLESRFERWVRVIERFVGNKFFEIGLVPRPADPRAQLRRRGLR